MTSFLIEKDFIISCMTSIKKPADGKGIRLIDGEVIKLADVKSKRPADGKEIRPANLEELLNAETSTDTETIANI